MRDEVDLEESFDKPTTANENRLESRRTDLISRKDKCRKTVTTTINLSDIIAVYRNLRENYEYNFRYDEAGKFFIREMELKRKYRRIDLPEVDKFEVERNHCVRRNLSLTGLYYHLFKYGESLIRPFLCVILPFLVVSIFLLLFEDIISLRHDVSIVNAIVRFFSDIFQGEGKDHLELLDYFIRVLSLGILGMYLIPLRRRFERKFRH